MELNLLKPRIALNEAFMKVKPNRPEIELFKKNLMTLLDNIDKYKSEEFHKNLVSDFLKIRTTVPPTRSISKTT